MKYIYEQEFYNTKSVKMLFSDQSYNEYFIQMEYDKQEHYWFCECELDIIRYKFVVNDIIRLNDPMAKRYVTDERGEVWSVQDYTDRMLPRMVRYNVSDGIESATKGTRKKTMYIYTKTMDLYISTSIIDVKDIHSVTYISFQPDGRIYQLEERMVGEKDKAMDYNVLFCNHIAHNLGRVAEGMWSFQIYLDGRCVIKDYFSLKRKVFSDTALLNYKI